MTSISEFATLMSAFSPKTRIYCLVVAALSVSFMVFISAAGFKNYIAPDFSRLVVMEGRIASHPRSWEHNRSLVHVSVSYKLGSMREGKPVYIYRDQYEGAGLRINSKIFLTVECLEKSSVVREVRTEDGRILYDDRHLQQIIFWNNQSIRGFLVFGGGSALAFLVAALLVALCNRGEKFSAKPNSSEA